MLREQFDSVIDRKKQYRGMVAEVARKAHYLEVGGSNPSPTTLLEDTRGELLIIVDVDKSALR